MSDLHEDSSSEDSATDAGATQHAERSRAPEYLQRLRSLELELLKTRNEAEAARLNAKAAALELKLRQLTADGRSTREPADIAVEPSGLPAKKTEQPGRRDVGTTSVRESGQPRKAPPSQKHPRKPRPARVYRPDQAHRSGTPVWLPSDSGLAADPSVEDSSDDDSDVRETRSESTEDGAVLPTEASRGRFQSWNDLRRAVGRPLATTKSHAPADETPVSARVSRQISESEFDAGKIQRGDTRSERGGTRPENAVELSEPQCAAIEHAAIELDAEATDEDEASTRSRPAAWMVSGVLHALIFLFLAFFTLTNQQPQDQVALAGAVSETDEAEIESLEIETVEMQAQPSESTPSDVEAEVTEFGEIPVSDVVNDLPATVVQPMTDSMQPSDYTNAAMSLKSDSEAKIQFCGVAGGGNHFVYLVDSSKSMGDAFQSARSELIRSIGLLKPNQRFYVIFFDAESDYMRLESPNRDEPRSVYATPENKAALARWARTIQMDRGRAPYDAIPFALELRPDVIFLLSDGEFPQRIEEILQELNHYSNLFGDEGRVSIVHTIGYHSREGESRMLRIAKQNGGQYRHVPEP